MKQKHLLKLLDWSKEDIVEILDLADKLKYENKNNIKHHKLSGKTLGMIFQKSSTRTRISFEVGMYQLGGQALFLSNRDLQIGRGESVKDTARVLSRYLDGVMIRTFAQQEVEDFASYGSIPIINGLTDFCHPCQVLADLMTIREIKGDLSGLTLTFIGDGNNMMNSLIVGGLKLGMKVNVSYPKGYEPAQEVLDFAGDNTSFNVFDTPLEASEGSDVLITDVYTSMGQEAESEKRLNDFSGYQINNSLLSRANSGALVLHCLPAHREEEITEEVFEGHSKEIFEESENRLHAQKAVMLSLLG